jgi:hypothetical protein
VIEWFAVAVAAFMGGLAAAAATVVVTYSERLRHTRAALYTNYLVRFSDKVERRRRRVEKASSDRDGHERNERRLEHECSAHHCSLKPDRSQDADLLAALDHRTGAHDSERGHSYDQAGPTSTGATRFLIATYQPPAPRAVTTGRSVAGGYGSA